MVSLPIPRTRSIKKVFIFCGGPLYPLPRSAGLYRANSLTIYHPSQVPHLNTANVQGKRNAVCRCWNVVFDPGLQFGFRYCYDLCFVLNTSMYLLHNVTGCFDLFLVRGLLPILYDDQPQGSSCAVSFRTAVITTWMLSIRLPPLSRQCRTAISKIATEQANHVRFVIVYELLVMLVAAREKNKLLIGNSSWKRRTDGPLVSNRPTPVEQHSLRSVHWPQDTRGQINLL